MLYIEAYMLIGILFLAGKDGTSYRLKDKNRPANDLDKKRINRWHRDGVALQVLLTLPLMMHLDHTNLVVDPAWWKIALYSLLIRLTVYDPMFNKWGGLGITYLGSSALFDRLFIRIFNANGAIWKSLTFLLITIIINLVT